MSQGSKSKLTIEEIFKAFADPTVAERFPPILTLERASELFGVPEGTIRDWKSRGHLDAFTSKKGKHVRFFRDRFVLWFFTD
ncbi:helix-turn-helix domain-containing protein [Bremerella sp. JC817]|uniref:helix-turn-helix domain-containing protein n=1 Tax=Bremerella sp. JC817 TaxID=3231756 RepID=UPI00345AC42A